MGRDGFPESCNVDRTGGSVSTIVQKKVLDYQGTAEPVLPVSEVSAVQLKPGPPHENLTIFSSEKAAVLGMHFQAASVGVVVMKPEYFGFMWWDGSQDCRINGDPARRTVLYTQGAQDGFHAHGGPRRTMGAAVRRRNLVETIAALRGIDPEDSILKPAALELSPEAATRFRAGVRAFFERVIRTRPEDRLGTSAADPGEAMFGLLVDAFLHASPEENRDNRRCAPERIVRRAEERFFSAEGAPVSLADLCAATGVSQSTLYRAFHAVCGAPPLAYFHKRRLTHARQILVQSPVYRGAVKQAALDVGLTELGRFSVEYRQLFGESPTTTLNKTMNSWP